MFIKKKDWCSSLSWLGHPLWGRLAAVLNVDDPSHCRMKDLEMTAVLLTSSSLALCLTYLSAADLQTGQTSAFLEVFTLMMMS